jgi:hypothetical protein
MRKFGWTNVTPQTVNNSRNKFSEFAAQYGSALIHNGIAQHLTDIFYHIIRIKKEADALLTADFHFLPTSTCIIVVPDL